MTVSSVVALLSFVFCVMIRRPPKSTRTDTLFPYTTLFRSARARRQATGLGAVHAAVLADQPFEVTGVGFMLGEEHQGPGVCAEVLRVVVSAEVVTDIVAQLVPFRAGDLAGRSEERRVGKECVSTCRSGGSQ